MNVPTPLDDVARVDADVERVTRRLHVLHGARLQCKQGCSACCVDELTVFEVEAAHIRVHHSELLASGAPHAMGACAFLDGQGGCRIYFERPYVCRTQGLPLRWMTEGDAQTELRDICPLNEPGDPIEGLPAADCWTIGPTEERLARLQLATTAPSARVRLRDLFLRLAPTRQGA